MPTEAKMTSLRQEQKFLKWQMDTLMAEMQETKIRRQALEKEHKEATLRLSARIAAGDSAEAKDATDRLAAIEQELLAVEEKLQLTNSRVQQLQRDSALVTAEIHRVDAQAANTAERVKRLRHDLFLMKRKQDPDSPLVVNAIGGIQKDLKASEDKYIGLFGEDLPDEAA